MKRDGHIHSPYCPHGTKDSFEQYIEKAIASGFTDISFTEHAPAPEGFLDPTPERDSFMTIHEFETYVNELKQLQRKYHNQIRIRIGIELDYIEGYEIQTTAFLKKYGHLLDDAILSVHFLKYNGTYTCIDFSDEVFIAFAKQVGSVEAVYQLYYDTIIQSIQADLGMAKPKRIGHPTLIHKFQLAHKETINDDTQVQTVLRLIAKKGYELDVNSAGLSKKYCLESYPPVSYITLAKELQIPLVFGSDAHQASDLHNYYDDIMK
ncbi:histidinol-phosphatase HisJ [Kurthia senegalensis]|uniref:histidinol-phosphatase HisJ n=1 Tax=Kurthia senegalensis TaxID=1033740 RepID=UPI00028A3FF0|nr:histidinol-phosphatase HisJ [Kurthia senegalensis]